MTGAYGYLGSAIRARLDAASWTTAALVRTPKSDDRAVGWELGEFPPAEILATADALVHCAYDFGPSSADGLRRVNVDGTEALLQSCTDAGVDRCLVLSSMSAYTGTKQLYGQTKLAIESVTTRFGGIAVRPGLVYSDNPRGMAGTLTKLTRLPLVPDFGPRARQYPVHELDLVNSVHQILNSPTWNPEVFGIAQPRAVSMRTLLKSLAENEGNSCRFVRTPWPLVYGALRVAAAARVSSLRADSILGLVRPAPDVPRSRSFPAMLDGLRTMEPSR